MSKDNESLNTSIIKKGEPCDKCRKRDSCYINPYKNMCVGFEAGTPWSIQFEKICANLPQ